MSANKLLKPKSYDKKKQYDNEHYHTNFFCLIVWVFVICCTIGFIVETAYEYITDGIFINKQGMLYGPFKPIYGFGGVLFTLLFYRIRYLRSYVIFIGGAVAGAVYEFLCSYIQQYLMKSQSWDYSHLRYNIAGRINPVHSVYWGILVVLFIKLILPLIIKMVNYVPQHLHMNICIVITILMCADMFLSLSAVTRHVERLEDKPAKNSWESFLDKHYNDNRIETTFTNMKFVYVKKKSK